MRGGGGAAPADLTMTLNQHYRPVTEAEEMNRAGSRHTLFTIFHLLLCSVFKKWICRSARLFFCYWNNLSGSTLLLSTPFAVFPPPTLYSSCIYMTKSDIIT